jgi:cell division protein FtsB
VTDSTPSNRAAREGARWRYLRAELRFVTVTAVVAVLLGIFVGGHFYGLYLSTRDLAGRDSAIEQLRAESQKLKRQSDQLSAQVTDLQAKLDRATAALMAIMPSDSTYNIAPNQSLIVADGHLMVGLVGSPSNETVTLDINGKQQALAAGQVVTVAPDPATTCTVQVQSFDMFKAVLTASCPSAKPK